MKTARSLRLWNVFAMLAVLLMLSACLNTKSSTESLPEVGDLAELPPMASTVGNYEDIEVPEGMKFINKDSMSMRTDSFRGGIMHYKGRIDAYSLKDYLISSMKKNMWKLAGEVSSQNVILAFTKPHRTCMILIEPNSALMDTALTMYVTVDLAGSQNLNPFGEPVSQ